MKLLSSASGKEWVEVKFDDAIVDEKNNRIKESVDRLLTELLLSENLIVLAGLGSSLCVKDVHGNSLAPTMKNLWDLAKTKSGDKFDSIKTTVDYQTPTGGEDNIELLLSRCQTSEKLKSNADVKGFISDTEDIIVQKCRFVKNETELSTHQSFIRKIARRPIRLPRIKLFTTNYDLCFEVAANRSRFIVIDGFSHTQPQEFDGSYFNYDLVRREQNGNAPNFIANVFHLYKLHGSVDWELNNSQVIKTTSPQKPLIIYPRDSKFESSYDQPFLESMSRFQMALRQPDTALLVIGFGFNDTHISQPILSAIRSNVNLKVVIVDIALENTTKRNLKDIVTLIKDGDSRLALLEIGFEDFIKILPSLVTKTEDEIHGERIRKLGSMYGT